MSKHKPHPFLKRPLLLALVMTMMLVMLPITASASDYEGHWARQYIDKAGAQGWMSGYPDGTFRPDNSISRAEFSAMLWRAQGSPAPSGGSQFSDVAEDAWYYGAVTALYEAGVVSGMGDGVFAPDDVLTREMGITMLARAFGLTPSNMEAYARFADSGAVSTWARSAVSALTERGYVSGTGDNQCAPGKALTRGEMAKLLVTVFEGEKAKPAPTVPGDTEGTDETNPVITLSYSPTGTTSGTVTVTVKVTSDSEVTYIGMRSSSSGATYSSNEGFTEITKTSKFSVTSNGWYAVCALDKDKNFNYKLIQITNIRSSGGGGGGGGGSGNVAVTGVTISGTVAVGDTLTANVAPSNATSVTYAWYVSDTNANTGGTAIDGATSNTYVIAADKEGKYIYVVVKGTGSSTAASAAVGPVAVAPVSVTRSTNGLAVYLTLKINGASPNMTSTIYVYGNEGWTSVPTRSSGVAELGPLAKYIEAGNKCIVVTNEAGSDLRSEISEKIIINGAEESYSPSGTGVYIINVQGS